MHLGQQLAWQQGEQAAQVCSCDGSGAGQSCMQLPCAGAEGGGHLPVIRLEGHLQGKGSKASEGNVIL